MSSIMAGTSHDKAKQKKHRNLFFLAAESQQDGPAEPRYSTKPLLPLRILLLLE